MSATAIDAPTLFSYRELEEPTRFILNAHYRCDSCGAQAYNRATFPNGWELFFCAHHGRVHYDGIKGLLKEWYCEEIRLQENRLVGSEN